jgi:hypothetical protein
MGESGVGGSLVAADEAGLLRGSGVVWTLALAVGVPLGAAAVVPGRELSGRHPQSSVIARSARSARIASFDAVK